MSFENGDYEEGKESLAGDKMVGTIVSVNFDGTTKFGEAQVRISAIHGGESETPDDSLPVALFVGGAFPESFGTFDVGDEVLVSFMNGSRQAPIIEGKVFDLDKVSEIVPEYASSYGKVKGILSKALKASIFFDEYAQTINIRFTDGAKFVLTKDSITTNSKNVTINTEANTTINASGSVAVNATGKASLTSDSMIELKAPIIREN